MAKKVFEIQIDTKKLGNSAKSQKIKAAKTVAEKEVETFGIVEINNASAKSKIKNANDVGYEKNVTDCQKKAVKSQVSQVEDYFDFSFRPALEEKVVEAKPVEKKAKKVATKKAVSAVAETKVEIKAKAETKAKSETKVAVKAKAQTKTTKKATAEKTVKSAEKTAVYKAEKLEQNDERQANVVAEACERISFDDEAERIICVARLGSLFDCDVRMLDC